MKKREELLKSPYYWEEKISNLLATGAGSKEIAEEITDRIKEYDKIVRLDDVSKPRDLLIAYELSQEFDGANPTQGMAEEMADKFLATYSPCEHSEDDAIEKDGFMQCKCGKWGEHC